MAGLACAQGLARQGFSVLLLDRLHPMPDCLKAEKIDGDAVLALLRLGFAPAVQAALTPLYNVSVFFGERPLGKLRRETPEASGHYHALINSLRDHLDPRVHFRPGVKAVSFEQRSDGVEVVTDQQTRFTCRLVALATGDARRQIEQLGAVYETQEPQQTFVVGFSLDGPLRDSRGPVDSLTFHHPIANGPVAYATFFRLGNALRANIFCPGPVSETWQRDLKQRPLQILAEHNHALAVAARSWEMLSPTIIRKVQVSRLQPPTLPRVVALGDAAHTIDPSGGGGMTLALREVELLLGSHVPGWLRNDDLGAAAIQSFYADARRNESVQWYFNRGKYIFALNHDSSLRGKWRRVRFSLDHVLEAQAANRRAAQAEQGADAAWRLPAPYLHEQEAP